MSLKSILRLQKEFNEVIVVDQSESSITKDMIERLDNKKIKYIHSAVPSITIARNIGVNNVCDKSKFICFLDDDVDIGKNYFEEILSLFGNDTIMGVAAFDNSPCNESILSSLIRKMFFLRHRRSGRMTSPYGNNYPMLKHFRREIDIYGERILLPDYDAIIVEWFPGVNMCFRKEVFKEQSFDENLLGYTVAEDIDFTYRLTQRYPNSLFITPLAQFVHRGSMVSRTPTKKMAYINQVDHFYFFFKNMSDKKCKFIWSLIGISIFKALTFNRYYFSSLFYCLRNLDKIKQGKVREFESCL
jgi:GT2 family glycosyltransferase